MMVPTVNTKFDRAAHLADTKSLRGLLADLRKIGAWLWMAAVAAFLASAFFVVKYFVGGAMDPALWTGEQWGNALLGLGITAVITAAQALLYASGYKGHAAMVATVIVVFFGMFAEVSQSMEREDATVRQRSESSPVFRAALGSISAISASAGSISPEQKALADTRAQLQYWQQQKPGKYSRATVERNLARYQKAIASLEGQTSAQGANRAGLLAGAIAQAKALEYDEDKHYAMIRLIRSLFGVTGVGAAFLFSIIIIGTFEYAFHFVGTYVADHKEALRRLGRDASGELLHPAADGDAPARPAQPPVHDQTRERLFKLVFTEVRTQILKGGLKPTVRPVTEAVTEVIRSHTKTLGLQPSLIGKPERQKIAENILEKLEQDAVLKPNQDQGIGKPKYVLSNHWVQPPAGEMAGVV